MIAGPTIGQGLDISPSCSSAKETEKIRTMLKWIPLTKYSKSPRLPRFVC